MRFRFTHALVAALSACVMLFGATAIAIGAPGNGKGNGGSGSTATSGPGNSGQGCDGTHNSDTGHGANQGGPYDNTCDGSPSGNGNGGGQATGKPCAGCVGNADDKNPGYNNGKGQMPNGSDHNAGYECDRNHGIGRSNPAHTGCTSGQTTQPQTCPNGQPMPKNGKCGSESPPPPKTCPNGEAMPASGNCGTQNSEKPPVKTCPNGEAMPASGNCGGGSTEHTTTPAGNTPETPQQAVLGERVSSPEATTAPAQSPGNQKVLGVRVGGAAPAAAKAPASATAPAAAQQVRAAQTTGQLPFTGTDLIAVLLAGALMLMAGLALRHVAAQRS